MRRTISLIPVAFLVCLAVSATAEPITLANKFTAGEVDKYKVTMNMSMSVRALSGSSAISPISMTIAVAQILKTLEVMPDGSARVQLTYQNPQVSGSGLPSAKKAALQKSLSMVLKVTPDGQITGVEGLESMIAGAGQASLGYSFLGGQFGVFGAFPAEPVEVGGTWKQIMPMAFGTGQMSMASKLEAAGEPLWNEQACRITQSYDGRADIGSLMRMIAGSMRMTPDTSALASMTGSMEFTGTGEYYFSPAKGKVLKGSGSTNATVRINLPAVGNQPASTLELGMSMTTNLTRFR